MESLSNPYIKAFALFLVWVVTVNVFVFIFGNRFNLLADNSYEWMQPADHFPPAHVTNLTDSHVRWDSLWYLEIAEGGYAYNGPGQLSNIAFFPVYPSLIALFGPLFGYALSGWLISLVALLGSALLLVRYMQEHHPDIDPQDTLFFLLIFPTAIFFNAVYTESLFLLFVLSTFYFGLKRHFWLAGLFGILASLTRVTGILLILPLLIEYVIAMKEEKKKFGLDILGVVLPSLGIISFFTYHWARFGSPTLFFEVQDAWGRGFELETNHFLAETAAAQVNLYLDYFFVAFAVVATILLAMRLRLSYAAFIFIGILVPIATGTFMSVGRYLLILFPIYILAASYKEKLVRQSWVLVSGLLFALYSILFTVNYWAG